MSNVHWNMRWLCCIIVELLCCQCKSFVSFAEVSSLIGGALPPYTGALPMDPTGSKASCLIHGQSPQTPIIGSRHWDGTFFWRGKAVEVGCLQGDINVSYSCLKQPTFLAAWLRKLISDILHIVNGSQASAAINTDTIHESAYTVCVCRFMFSISIYFC